MLICQRVTSTNWTPQGQVPVPGTGLVEDSYKGKVTSSLELNYASRHEDVATGSGRGQNSTHSYLRH